MKKLIFLLPVVLLLLTGCAKENTGTVVAATTKPVAQFTSALLEGTDKQVACVITESVSCLHDHSLTVKQMKLLEQADLIILSGGGMEDFMLDALKGKTHVLDCSKAVSYREGDPHYWLDPLRARDMARAIATELTRRYPENADQIAENLLTLEGEFSSLISHGENATSSLSCRELVTFHDGFSYLAESLNLSILASMEEEHGSEVSAKDLEAIISLVKGHKLPAIFTEVNGSTVAAQTVSGETGVRVFALDMAMGERDYFSAMRYNVDIIKEALA